MIIALIYVIGLKHAVQLFSVSVLYILFRFKSLIALLFHHIEIGQSIGSGGGYAGADRDLGLKATSLYFILLSIPGSSAFKIFHPMLYSKALDTFKLAKKLHVVRIIIIILFALVNYIYIYI